MKTIRDTIVAVDENEDFTYYINESKRTIVCVFTPDHSEYCTGFEKAMKKVINETGYAVMLDPKCPVCYMDYPDTFEGKAKCAPEDEWDAEYGKRLAKARALAKFHAAKSNYISEIVWSVSSMLDLTREISEKHDHILANRMENLENILKESEK